MKNRTPNAGKKKRGTKKASENNKKTIVKQKQKAKKKHKNEMRFFCILIDTNCLQSTVLNSENL